MKVKIWKRPRMVERGVFITPDGLGRRFEGWEPWKAHFEVPVVWCGQGCKMRFFGHFEDVPINKTATRLLKHERLVVRGPVQIVTCVDVRFKLRAWATHQEVVDSLQHVDLSAKPIIVDVGKRVAQQDIYVVTKNDQFWTKMGL